MQTPNQMNGCPKYCSACQKPFLIRRGRKQAQVGQALSCYGMTPECVVHSAKPVMLKRAS